MVEETGNGYQIVEEWAYTDALENNLEIGLRQADEALGAILYALSLNPTAFEAAHDNNIRVAKLAERPLDGLPAFRVFFRVNEEQRTVFLLYVDHG